MRGIGVIESLPVNVLCMFRQMRAHRNWQISIRSIGHDTGSYVSVTDSLARSLEDELIGIKHVLLIGIEVLRSDQCLGSNEILSQ